ncbi:MAG: hypothetical protein KDD40_03195, partial [Bdellovibrionales bacterium]|nr:hypothetical protein [Bdellovibrionales bacterium]
ELQNILEDSREFEFQVVDELRETLAQWQNKNGSLTIEPLLFQYKSPVNLINPNIFLFIEDWEFELGGELQNIYLVSQCQYQDMVVVHKNNFLANDQIQGVAIEGTRINNLCEKVEDKMDIVTESELSSENSTITAPVFDLPLVPAEEDDGAVEFNPIFAPVVNE